MCLEISNNLLLMLQDAPKLIFSTNSHWSAKKRCKDTLFSPSIPFPRYFLQLQQCWHLYCFAILGSASIVIHSVKQRLLRNRPGSALLPLATSCAKDYKAHSLQQTSFAESPNSSNQYSALRSSDSKQKTKTKTKQKTADYIFCKTQIARTTK